MRRRLGAGALLASQCFPRTSGRLHRSSRTSCAGRVQGKDRPSGNCKTGTASAPCRSVRRHGTDGEPAVHPSCVTLASLGLPKDWLAAFSNEPASRPCPLAAHLSKRLDELRPRANNTQQHRRLFPDAASARPLRHRDGTHVDEARELCLADAGCPNDRYSFFSVHGPQFKPGRWPYATGDNFFNDHPLTGPLNWVIYLTMNAEVAHDEAE